MIPTRRPPRILNSNQDLHADIVYVLDFISEFVSDYHSNYDPDSASVSVSAVGFDFETTFLIMVSFLFPILLAGTS